MYYSIGCRHEPKPIFIIGDTTYYACDQDHALHFDGDLLVNLTSRPNIPSSLLNIPELAEYVDVSFKEITVGWPDFGVPPLKLEFWEQLHKYIVKNKYKKVCFHCMAGHGRTGTALAAMLIAKAGYSSVKAVDFIREEHCKKVVESHSQCRYLHILDVFYNNADIESKDVPEPRPQEHYSEYSPYFSAFPQQQPEPSEKDGQIAVEDENGKIIYVDEEDIESIELTDEDDIIFD